MSVTGCSATTITPTGVGAAVGPGLGAGVKQPDGGKEDADGERGESDLLCEWTVTDTDPKGLPLNPLTRRHTVQPDSIPSGLRFH